MGLSTIEERIAKKIPKRAIKDAFAVCGSLSRLNAKSAIGYAFCVNWDNKEVATGEFIFQGETPTSAEFDGFINFNNETLADFLADTVEAI